MLYKKYKNIQKLLEKITKMFKKKPIVKTTH